MIKGSKKDTAAVFFILVIFFSIVFIQHIDMDFVSDDYWNIQDTSLSSFSLGQLIHRNYYETYGRICSDVLGFLIYRIPFLLWKVLDSLVYVVMALLITFIFAEVNPLYTAVTCLLMLTYPKGFLQSAGYIMTTTNYVYTIFGLLLGLLPLKLIKINFNNRLALALSIVLGAFGIFFASNQDQSAMGTIGAFFLYLLWIIYIGNNSPVLSKQTHDKLKIYTFSGLMFSIACYVFMFLGPAHLARALGSSRGGRFSIPDYNSWSFFRKIYHGYTTTAANIIFNRCNIYILAISFLFILALFSDSKAKKIIGSIPLGISLLIKSVGSSTFTYYYDYSHDVADLKAFSDKYGIIAILLSFAAVISITGAIFMLFSDKKNAWIAFSALIIGGGSHLMMGFSSTLYGSSFRTLTLTLFSFMVISLLIFTEIKNRKGRMSLYMTLLVFVLIFTI